MGKLLLVLLISVPIWLCGQQWHVWVQERFSYEITWAMLPRTFIHEQQCIDFRNYLQHIAPNKVFGCYKTEGPGYIK